MKGNKLVIVIDKGTVSEVYSTDPVLKVIIVDYDNKRIGEDYIDEWGRINKNRVNELLKNKPV